MAATRAVALLGLCHHINWARRPVRTSAAGVVVWGQVGAHLAAGAEGVLLPSLYLPSMVAAAAAAEQEAEQADVEAMAAWLRTGAVVARKAPVVTSLRIPV